MSTFEGVMHMQGLFVKLCNQASDLILTVHCEEPACAERALSMPRLFMKVRVMHALKVSNIAHQSGGKGVKRNRKVLKLSHA